jgi:hypothetical protein
VWRIKSPGRRRNNLEEVHPTSQVGNDEEEEMQQQSRLQERSFPMDKMDEEIEEIRILMLN